MTYHFQALFQYKFRSKEALYSSFMIIKLVNHNMFSYIFLILSINLNFKSYLQAVFFIVKKIFIKKGNKYKYE